MNVLDTCRQIIDTESGRVLLYRDEVEAVLTAGDTISRRQAIDSLHMHLMYRMGTDSNKKRLDEWINNLPSTQPELIRCKDCKHYKKYEYTEILACHLVVGGTVRRNSDDFCSRAERREE